MGGAHHEGARAHRFVVSASSDALVNYVTFAYQSGLSTNTKFLAAGTYFLGAPTSVNDCRGIRGGA